MLTIAGYTYVCHKIIHRPWGVECRFTVSKDGRIIDDIVMLRDGKEDDKQLEILISSRLAVVDAPKPAEDPQEHIMLTERYVIDLLVDKGYLTADQTLVDLKAKDVIVKVI